MTIFLPIRFQTTHFKRNIKTQLYDNAISSQRNRAHEYSHLTGADACGELDSAHHSAPLAASASECAAPASLSVLERGSQAGRAQALTVSEVQRTGMMFPDHS